MRVSVRTPGRVVAATLVASLISLLRPPVAPAEGDAAQGDYAFYKGKVIEFYVPYAIGGGFDAYARGLKPLLEKYIPGVTVVVRNVPGGGGLTGTNQLYRARPDGLSIGILNGPGMVFSQILGVNEALYDLRKMSWIGRVNADTHVLVVATKSPVRTVQDLKNAKRVIVLAQTGKGSDDFFLSYMAFKALGVPLRNVVGFQGAPEAILGVLRGEEDGFMDSYSTLEKLINDGELRVVFQVALARTDPRIANAPTLLELVGENARAMIASVTNVFAFERPIAGPPGIPPARLAVLREALWASLNDPVMIAWSKKVRPILPLRGAETEELLGHAMEAGGTLKPLMQESLKP
jgi:tripartite-type tricarboxylate transporter receptor subunit TctC